MASIEYTFFSESHKKYLKMIGFTHPKKEYLLEKMINKRKIRKEKIEGNQIKHKVLKILEENSPLTKHDIANILKISSDQVLEALLNLREKGKVKGKFVNINKPYLWYISS